MDKLVEGFSIEFIYAYDQYLQLIATLWTRGLKLLKPDRNAKEIFQHLLDQIGSAILKEDADKYLSFVVFPHRLQTFDMSRTIDGPAELRQYFERFIYRLKELGVRELDRHCTQAEFIDKNTIHGFHETKIIDRDLVILENYFGLSTLRLADGVWKVADSQYAEPDQSVPTRVSQEVGK